MKIKINLIAIILMAILAVSCSDDNGNDPNNPDDPTPKVNYTIGVLIPLTGAGQSNGKQSKAAVDIAVQDINNYFSVSNVNVKINVIYKDSETDPAKALERLKEFADDGVKIVVGPYSSTVLQGLKNFADSAGILLISHSSVATTLAVKDDNIFRFAPNDVWQAKAIAKIMLADNKFVIIPLVRDDVWGRALYEEVEKELETSQITLQVPIYYPPSQTNFSAIVQNIKKQISDLQNSFLDKEIGVYMITYGEGVEILRQTSYFDEVKNIKFYGASAFAWNDEVGKNELAASTAVSTKLECPVMGYDTDYSNRYTPFIELLTVRIAREPDAYATSVYDALFAAGLTLSRSGDSVSVDKIKKELRTVLDSYQGLNGMIKLDDNDDRIDVIYDFMTLKLSGSIYKWYVSAKYDPETDELERK